MQLRQRSRKSEQAMRCSQKIKSTVVIKMNQNFIESLYNWILHHTQVVKSPIINYCLFVSIDGNSKKQLMPRLLFIVSVQIIHNSMMSPPEEGALKVSNNTYNCIIISDSTLQNILPYQL